MDLPDFIIIGATRCGTTSIYSYLRRHPMIYMPPVKEPRFFNYEYERGDEWYRSLFRDGCNAQVRGEATTSYTHWPHVVDVPERMSRLVPNVKLIYIMRHPVERTYSHYIVYAWSQLSLTLEEALVRDPVIVEASMYIRQIVQFLRYFSREQSLCLIYDDFKNHPSEILGKIQRFVGVDEIDVMAKGRIVAEVGQAYGRRPRVSREFRAVGRVPIVSKVIHSVPKSWRTKVYSFALGLPWGRRLAAQEAPRPMSDETRAMLLEKYREPTRELEEFLGRRCAQWYE